ncbi:MAG TPA: SDR family oxidoreductase [Aliiroseovarius sp.]|nr:SDR family oxidoreductase [Aliiroseovarius sp.]
MTNLSEKTVIITGASRGIGEAAAHEFAASGANVVLLARSAADISRIAADIGPQALAIPCDVSSWAEVSNAVNQAAAHFGDVHVLVNNAGVIEPISSLATSDPAAWGQVIDINLKGVYYGARAVLPLMHKAGGGSILTISSGAAHNALEGWSHYCASKAAVHMLTKCIHKEEAGKGIRAIGLSPGTVATQMQKEIKASGVNPVAALDWSDHIPADWPAKTLVWMCSQKADSFLGQEISLRDDAVRAAVGLTA